MSNLSLFFKINKKVKDNVFFPATKSLLSEDGTPLLWEIKPISTKEDEAIRDSCTKEIPIPGRPNMYRNRIDTSAYISKLLAACVVFPDLYNSELQDSYGVKTPEELLKEMIDNSGEYTEFTRYVQEFNGFNLSMNDQADEAKN